MKPELTHENMVAAYLMLHLWNQFGSNQKGDLVHNFMGAPENAGEWLEDMGLVLDVGYEYRVTKAGLMLMEADDHHAISRDLAARVASAVTVCRSLDC